MLLSDVRIAALGTGLLALAGGAVAVAALMDDEKSRSGIPVPLLRVGPVDLPGQAGGGTGRAVWSPPAGSFMATPDDREENLDEGGRLHVAFSAFDEAKPSAPMPPLSVLAFRPGLIPVRPAEDAAEAVHAALPATQPAKGTGGPLVVASLELPGPPAPRPSLRGDPAPILADEGAPLKMPKGAAPYLDLIRREARANGVPLWMALGLIWVESKYDPNLRGAQGVLGLMQVMPSTARYLGFTGTNEDLLRPEVNVKWGMKELAKDIRYAKGDVCLTAAKYKGGLMTPRVNAGAQRYCDLMRQVTGMDAITHVPVPPGPAPVVRTAIR